MKINYVIWHTNCTGGVRVMFNIANGLIDRGHDVSITSIFGDHRWFPLKAKVTYVPQFMKFTQHRAVLALPILTKILPKADITVATFCLTAYPVWLNGKGKKFYHVQHYETIFSKNPIYNILSIMTYHLPLNIICNSMWVKDKIKKITNKDPPIVNPGVDLELFKPVEIKTERIKKDKRIKRIVGLGKKKKWKGLADLFRAMELVYKERSDVELVLFGRQPPEIKTNTRFKFMENLSDGELVELYNSADIVVSPSWYESFPLPQLEAMACGTAVVTTRYGTEDYAFNEKNSLVVQPKNPEEMAKAILRLLSDKNLAEKLRKNGLKTAREFTWEKTINKVESIFKKINY